MTSLTIGESIKYRPSNGTEGAIFMSQYCFTCKKCGMDEDSDIPPCQILGRTFGYSIDEPEYPSEWTYNDQGDPICSAYVNENADDVYRCETTPDLFSDSPCEYSEVENNSK